MAVTKYLHIGFNKNFSTSLQRDFFGKHPEIHHLGAGCNDHNIGFIDADIEIAIEQHLRYSKDFIYADYRDQVKASFEKHFELADKDPSKKAVGISSEQMSFNLSPDSVDVTTKANRLFDIFGKETKVLIIIRNQMDFFQSMYREGIRDGYNKTYAEYMEYVYKFHSRNFVPDYFYDRVYEQYAELYGKENIKILLMEQVRNMETRKLREDENGHLMLLNEICEHIGVSYPEHKLGHVNPPLPESVSVLKQSLNARKTYGLSNSIYDGCQMHRVRKYYENVLKIQPPISDDDWRTKWANIEAAEHQVEIGGHQDVKIDYSFDPEIDKRLRDLYAKANSRFIELTGIDLSQYDYPL